MDGSSRAARASLREKQHAVIDAYLPLAERAGRPWVRRCRLQLEPEDILQEAALALTRASQRYDGSRRESFGHFVQECVRGAIRDQLRRLDPLSRRRRAAVRALQAARHHLRQALGREPGSADLAASLDWPAEDVERAAGDAAALEVGWAQTQERQSDAVADGPDACDRLIRGERLRRLQRALRRLSGRELTVVVLHYADEETMGFIGACLGVSGARASQIHLRALAKLRAAMEEPEASA